MVAEDTIETHLVLDPFDFHGRPASIIAGLGGLAPGSDPDYAFHTHYVPVARGMSHFTIRFTNLRAKRGTLLLRIHMLPVKPGSVARMVTSERIQFNRLVKEGGELTLRFEAFRGATYAIMGLVTDQTDAEADDLVILLDRPDDGSQDDGPPGTIEDSVGTRFEATRLRTSTHMVSLAAPIFASPVTQAATTTQFKASERQAWITRLGIPVDKGLHGWTMPYIAQAIERYGMLEKGVVALALSPSTEPLARLLEQSGGTVNRLAVNHRDAEPPPGWIPVSSRVLPGPHLAHDLVWSTWTGGTLAERIVSETIDLAMECLRPGGLAVHVVPYSRDTSQDPTAFDRNAVERVVLGLISRGHDVARVKLPLDSRLLFDEGGRGAFGIIARRAQSLL